MPQHQKARPQWKIPPQIAKLRKPQRMQHFGWLRGRQTGLPLSWCRTGLLLLWQWLQRSWTQFVLQTCLDTVLNVQEPREVDARC
jgi:hypothetical protein